MTPTAAGAGLGLTVIRPAAVEPNRAGSDIFVVRQVIGIRGKLLAVLALPTAVSLVARRRRPAGRPAHRAGRCRPRPQPAGRHALADGQQLADEVAAKYRG